MAELTRPVSWEDPGDRFASEVEDYEWQELEPCDDCHMIICQCDQIADRKYDERYG